MIVVVIILILLLIATASARQGCRVLATATCHLTMHKKQPMESYIPSILFKMNHYLPKLRVLVLPIRTYAFGVLPIDVSPKAACVEVGLFSIL